MKTAKRALALLLSVLLLTGGMSMSVNAVYDLQAEIDNAAVGATVTLSGDVTASVVIDKDLTLDLGGYTLTSAYNDHAILVKNANVTVRNGRVYSRFANVRSAELVKTVAAQSPGAIHVDGGALTVKGLRIAGSLARVPTTSVYFVPTGSAIESINGATVTVIQSSLYGRYGVNNNVSGCTPGGTVTIEDGILLGFLRVVKDTDGLVIPEDTEDVNAADRIEGFLNSGIHLEAREKRVLQAVFADRLHIYTKSVQEASEAKMTNCRGAATVTASADESRVWKNNTSTDASYKYVPEYVIAGDEYLLMEKNKDGKYTRKLTPEQAEKGLQIKYRLEFVLQDDVQGVLNNFDRYVQQLYTGCVKTVNEVYDYALEKYNTYMGALYDVDDLLQEGIDDGDIYSLTGKHLWEIDEYQELLSKLFALGGAVMVNKGEFTGAKLPDSVVYSYTGEFGPVPEGGIYGVLDRVAKLKNELETYVPLDENDQSKWPEMVKWAYDNYEEVLSILDDAEAAILDIQATLNTDKAQKLMSLVPEAAAQAAKLDTALGYIDMIQSVVDKALGSETVQTVLQKVKNNEDSIIPYTEKFINMYNNRDVYLTPEKFLLEDGTVGKAYSVDRDLTLEDETDSLHDYNAAVTDPTCTEGGYTTYTCSVCGKTYDDDATEALDHDYSVVNETVEPTCFAGGYTTYKCSRCGLVDPTKKDLTRELGHDYSVVNETVEPTCLAGGYTTYKCSRCGLVDPTKKDLTEELGHSITVEVEKVEPTCTEGGYTIKKCERCDETERTDYDALGHDYQAVEIAPTCLTEGYTIYVCSRCNDSYGHENVKDALDHKWNQGTVDWEPTCTEPGRMTYTCQRDLSHTKTEEIPALGHDWVKNEEESFAAECGKAGKTVSYCSRCGDKKEEVIPALEHIFDAGVVTDPTCYSGGYTTYTCSLCEYSYTADQTKPLGHEWKGVVIKEPSCIDEGTIRYVCQHDNTHRYEDEVAYSFYVEEYQAMLGEHLEHAIEPPKYVIPKLGHNYVKGATVAPTCEEEGYTTYICTRCSDTIKLDKEDAIGHDYVQGSLVSPATCETPAMYRFTCTHDVNHTYVAAVGEPLGHNYVRGELVTPATCEKPATYRFTCTNDLSHSIVKPDGEALGHDWQTVEVIKEATCQTDGLVKQVCSRDLSHTRTYVVPAGTHNFDHPNCRRETVVPATYKSGGTVKVYCYYCDEAYEIRSTSPLPEPKDDLIVTEARTGLAGNKLRLTIPYTRKGYIATTLSAYEDPNLELKFSSRDKKAFTVDSNGNVRFTRMSMFHRSSVITVTDQFGRTATCNIEVKYQWYHYLLWGLFGWAWY